MLADRARCPRLDARERFEAWIVAHEIYRQLAPHDKLLEKDVAVAHRGSGVTNSERHSMRPNLSEVKIRGEPAGAVELGAVAVAGVIAETFADEPPQDTQGLIRAPAKDRGTHRSVEMKAANQFRRKSSRFDVSSPAQARQRVSGRSKKLRQAFVNAWTDRAGGKLLFFDQNRR